MQLYTEEQVLKIIQKSVMDKPETYCEVLQHYKPIELPSNEEIKDKSFNKFTQSNARTCFEEGAKWVREKILNQNK